MMYYNGFDWWWMLLCIIGLGAVIWLIVWAITAAGRRNGPAHELPSRTPLEIAKERYARGEITRDQFEQMKKDLM
jgi:putative membrane protein